jgi:protein-glutamine gamma-glutamyltransferase
VSGTGEGTDGLDVRTAALITLLAGGLALGTAGLMAAPVCALALLLVLAAGLAIPRWAPTFTLDSPRRTTLALAAVAAIVLATAVSGPDALTSGAYSGALRTAAAELALPSVVPIGLLAALAAGALAAVALELGDRRGVQSALVLGTAVLGLATVAAPGVHLLPAIVPGWPAALYALTRLASTPAPPRKGAPVRVVSGAVPPDPRMVRRVAGPAGARTGAPIGRWQVLPVVAAVSATLLVLALALLTGAARLGERGGGFGGAGAAGGVSGGRTASDYLGGDMNLNSRGSLTSDPVFEVPADSPRLWRAGTLDQYTGRGWVASMPAAGLPRLARRQQGAVSVVPPPADTSRARTDRVHHLRPGVTQILAPGELIGFQAPGLDGGGAAFVGAGDRVTMAGRSDSTDYVVSSQTLPAVDDPASLSVPAGADRTDTTDPRWTTLPPAVPARVRQLGVSLVRSASSRADAVRAIEAELDSRMTYRLDSPVPPRGADTVDDVLFVSHSGFCEQFATAEVVLLRSAGVPARVAVGFAGGESTDAGVRTMRRSDAHAWVEFWMPGLGWVTSDPTPAGAEPQSRWSSLLKTWWERIKDVARSHLTWAVAGGLILLGLLGVWWRRRRHPNSGGSTDGPRIDADLAAAFERLELALQMAGRPRAPSETVSALAGRLRMERLRAGPLHREADVTPALQVLERALYAARAPSREECLEAAAALDRRLEDSTA